MCIYLHDILNLNLIGVIVFILIISQLHRIVFYLYHLFGLFYYGRTSDLLKNDIVLITGASGGVGTSLVEKIIEENWQGLLVTDQDLLSLIELQKFLDTSGFIATLYTITNNKLIQSANSISNQENQTSCKKNIILLCSDITDATIWDYLQELSYKVYNTKSINIIINNAGIGLPIPSLIPTSEKQLQDNLMKQKSKTYDVNLHAPIRLFQSCFSAYCSACDSKSSLPTTMSSIASPKQLYFVTVASAAAMSYATQLGPYCGSKAALVHNLRSMRFEHQRLLYEPKYQPNLSSCHQQKKNTSISLDQEVLGKTTSTFPWNNFVGLAISIFRQILPYHTKNYENAKRYEKDYHIPHIHWHTVLPWHIETKMFNNITSCSLLQILVPSLTRKQVAKQIIDHLLLSSQHTAWFGSYTSHTETVMPFLLTFTPLLSILPTWLSDLAVGLAGGWNGMDSWDDPRYYKESPPK